MIAIACDHAGLSFKKDIMTFLTDNDIKFKDYGNYTNDPIDYPILADRVCKAIKNNEADKGILICGTGIGMSIAANKHKNIRAALCSDSFTARMTRKHNDANVIVFGARVIGIELALFILDSFLNTEFSNEERHKRRISMLENKHEE